MIKYPKTGQYKDFVKDVGTYTNNVITLKGTVKLHGTNGGIRFPDCVPQSRNKELTIEDDNFNFAKFCETNREELSELYEHILKINNLQGEPEMLVFGEFAGKGIQDTVAIAQIERAFFLFGAALVVPTKFEEWNSGQPEEELYWLDEIDTNWPFTGDHIFSVNEFEIYSCEYDPLDPEKIIPLLEELTDKVETQCPIGNALGCKGPGEGIVWTYIHKGRKFSFKVKGKSHTTERWMKRKVTIEPERFSNIKGFVETVFDKERFDNIFQSGDYGSRDKIGLFIKAVMDDVYSEEADTIAASGFTQKEISKVAISLIKKYIVEKVD